MKILLRIIPLFSLVLLASMAHLPAAETDLKNLLQTGLMAEEVEGDMAKAATAYEGMIQAGEEQQKLLATALYRLAEVRRKQQKKAEAAALYMRLVREFPGQEPLAKLARENLVALGVAVEDGPAASASAPTPEDPETREVARMEKLLEESPDVARAELPLHLAALNGWKHLAERMMARGFDPNKRGRGAPPGNNSAVKEDNVTPLAIAAAQGHKAVAELLLAKGADVNDGLAKDGSLQDAANGYFIERTPLAKALAAYRVEISRLLLERGASLHMRLPVLYRSANYPEERVLGTPLHAVLAGNSPPAALVKLLLDHGAKVDAVTTPLPDLRVPAQDSWLGRTPLFYAAARNTELVALLVDAGADVNTAAADGSTPLFQAPLPCAEWLLDHGAKVDAHDKQGRTALIHCLGDEPKARLLLAKGANPALKDHEGNSLLHIAAADPRPMDPAAMSDFLLSLPLDFSAPNKAGKTARDLLLANPAPALELMLAVLARTTPPGPGVSQFQGDLAAGLRPLFTPLAEDEPMPTLAEVLGLIHGRMLQEGGNRRANAIATPNMPSPVIPTPSRRRQLIPGSGQSWSDSSSIACLLHPSPEAGRANKSWLERVPLEGEAQDLMRPLRPGAIVQISDAWAAVVWQKLLAQPGALPATKITVVFEGLERTFVLGGEDPWHPTTPSLPWVLWSGVLEPLARGLDAVDLRQVKLVRSVNGRRVDHTMNLLATNAAPLPRIIHGDRVELVKKAPDTTAADAAAKTLRVQMPDVGFQKTISLTKSWPLSAMLGMLLHTQASGATAPVAQDDQKGTRVVTCNWLMNATDLKVPAGRDWSRVMIWRAGQSTPEVFDMDRAAAALASGDSPDALQAKEPQLSAGDRIELPLRKGGEALPLDGALFQYIRQGSLTALMKP